MTTAIRILFRRAATITLLVFVIAACGALAQARVDFDQVDANHDGRITFQEFQAYATPRLMTAQGPRAERFQALSSQQQTAVLRERFNRLDQGHKGHLDRNDWERR